MVVSLLTPPQQANPAAAAEHRFAYPRVRPVPRPVHARDEQPRTW